VVLIIAIRASLLPLFPYTTLFRSSWKSDDCGTAGSGGSCASAFGVVGSSPRPKPSASSPLKATAAARLNPRRFLRFFSILTSYRSEEHTSELQSRFDLVCRLLLEK